MTSPSYFHKISFRYSLSSLSIASQILSSVQSVHRQRHKSPIDSASRAKARQDSHQDYTKFLLDLAIERLALDQIGDIVIVVILLLAVFACEPFLLLQRLIAFGQFA